MESVKLVYDEFITAEESLREVLTSTGNGYFCTRGTAEWQDSDDVHYAGTYAHGAYNRETTIMGGVPVHNEDLVNLPNWLVLKLRIEGEDAIQLGNVELLSYRHTYDIRCALVSRELRFRDRAGRVTTVRSRRFVSMAHVHQAALEWTIVPENWAGKVSVVSAIDGRVTNANVARYRQLEGRHLEPVSPRTFGPEVIALKSRTRHSRLYVAEAARTRVFLDDDLAQPERSLYQTEDYIQQLVSFPVAQGRPARVEKLVSFYTSQDRAIDEPLGAAGRSVSRYGNFAHALARHQAAWDELWRACELRLPAEPRVQLLLRLHTAHILQVCSRHTSDLDAGVPARGLNGEAYRGHVFWDELYVYPFLNLRLPEITRKLLMYRYRRLGEARAAAAEAGFAGAMFPWQSGSNGQEETQVLHLNPLSGRWDPDHTQNQRHVNAAIFYNVWQYYQATEDLDFLREHGAEMMLEIARFWASIAHYNPERDRYEIHGVMGPDEFHERYPDAQDGGLRNNAYTNVLVAWIADRADTVLCLLPESRRKALRERIGLTDAELEKLREMSAKMFVPFLDNGIVSQFEGYQALKELDWDAYRARYPNIQRLDRILKAEGDGPDRYKLTKQADAVLLFFLFSDTELARLFRRLGYEYDPETARRTVEYYDQRTSHGSTLSFIAHAGVLAAIDPESSWERFLAALESDIGDIQGGTTKEGIHMGVMSGTLDLVQRAYAGTTVRDGVLFFEPRLLDRLDGLNFSMQFRGTPLDVGINGNALTVLADPEGASRPVRVGVGGQIQELCSGDRWTFTLSRPSAAVSSTTTGGPFMDAHRRTFKGAIFDVDGVLVDSPHERAWREGLRELMENEWSDIRGETTWAAEAFTPLVYQQVMSGKPRMAGALAALRHFNVPEAPQRVALYAARKQQIVIELIKAGEFEAYPDALRFILSVHAAGIPVAAASSSKNADLFLERIRLDSFAAENGLEYDFVPPGLTLLEFFDADISGRDFAQGKPHPEIFLTAAKELGVAPQTCLVVEDAVTGIQAAKAGGMAALGLARANDSAMLADAHADLVVEGLDDVDLDALRQGRLIARVPTWSK